LAIYQSVKRKEALTRPDVSHRRFAHALFPTRSRCPEMARARAAACCKFVNPTAACNAGPPTPTSPQETSLAEQSLGAEIPFRESFYLGLPEDFYKPALPSPPPAPNWVVFNRQLAAELGMAPDSDTPDLLNLLSGGAPEKGENIALAYSGHQFGVWNPLMGDGRAVIVGEIAVPGGHVYDIHLKGSGPTPFARRGDGRATLSAMLREYLVSEAMAGLKIPTTRALAVTATGAPVFRDGARPGAVLARVARSHIRVGTFQYAAGRDAA